MDDWFALRPRARRGRSGVEYKFALEAPGPAIRAQQPYAFIDCLELQNELLIHREINDPVYRGDVKPQDSCAWLPRDDDDDDSSDSGSTAATATSSLQERQSSPETPRRDLAPSPTMTELIEVPRRLITYTKSDRARARANAAALALRTAGPTRRSARLSRGNVEDNVNADVLRQELAVSRGHEIVAWMGNIPRPIVDRLDYVIAVVAGAPKGESHVWNLALKQVEQALGRMFRNGLFTKQTDNQSYLRLGIGYGEEYAAPHEFVSTPALAREVEYIRNNVAFNVLSSYQNHLYAQFAPRGHATVANQVNELVNRNIVYPAFDNSVFTTTHINFRDSPTLSQKNYNGALGTMEAVTLIGKPGFIVFWEDGKVMELQSGATVIFPAGTKRYSFMPVGPGEEPFLFRQFCHGGVLRWVEKGGHSDSEFDALASREALEVWDAKRARRGQDGLKMFSKLGELFVL